MSKSINGQYCTFEWDIQPGEMLDDLLTTYGSLINSVVLMLMEDWAPKIVDWMKENAPWNDITGDARNGLVAKAYLVFNEYVAIQLAHTVTYGTYLEGWNPRTNAPMENAGQWSIIEPAIDYFGPKIMADLRQRMGI